MRSLVAISPSAQMKPPSLTILTLFSAPLTGLRSGAMNASAISLIEMLEFLPSTLRSTAARSTAPGSAKVEFPSAEFGEPLKLQPQPGSQLQSSRYVPEIVQLVISLVRDAVGAANYETPKRCAAESNSSNWTSLQPSSVQASCPAGTMKTSPAFVVISVPSSIRACIDPSIT